MACSEREIEIIKCGEILKDDNNPLIERYQSLNKLRNEKSDLAVDTIIEAFKCKSDLLRHDLAYSLGQMGNERATSFLHNLLDNPLESAIVRHEAGEALGAIGNISSMEILKKYSNDCNDKELAETCYLSYKRIEMINSNNCNIQENPFKSIDPVPEFHVNEKPLHELKEMVLDPNAEIVNKYQSLFTLRRIAYSGGEYSQDALTTITMAMKSPNSTLFRHQVAFVLGQLAHPSTIPALRESLADNKNIRLVRHESAEALGAIDCNEAKKILNNYLDDTDDVIKQRCVLALGRKQ